MEVTHEGLEVMGMGTPRGGIVHPQGALDSWRNQGRVPGIGHLVLGGRGFPRSKSMCQLASRVSSRVLWSSTEAGDFVPHPPIPNVRLWHFEADFWTVVWFGGVFCFFLSLDSLWLIS